MTQSRNPAPVRNGAEAPPERGRASYITRRRKEDLSFMIVRFLWAFDRFVEVHRDFSERLARGRGFEGAGLFARTRDIEERLVFDIKEKAHFLFRPARGEAAGSGAAASGAAGAEAGAAAPGPEGCERRHFEELEELLRLPGDRSGRKRSAVPILQDLRRSLVSRTLDSYVGTGFHMFMILRESLYQLEFYAPGSQSGREQVDRLERLALELGYPIDDADRRELDHIRELSEVGRRIHAETAELTRVAFERCHALFRETAEVLRHLIVESAANEVLVLNLLREERVVDRIFGAAAAERLFREMFRTQQGRAAALAHARRHCGNVEGIPERGSGEGG